MALLFSGLYDNPQLQLTSSDLSRGGLIHLDTLFYTARVKPKATSYAAALVRSASTTHPLPPSGTDCMIRGLSEVLSRDRVIHAGSRDDYRSAREQGRRRRAA